ncbi:MAG: methionyl-tRNA formyltransferase [Nitrospirae bacterium CG_4_10_14_3_um_filter_44_29]|nr:methionyl-tRNA formyltransferase [Nitrospirota bacterium]OIO29806.1 MAG: methionyl-tRNA formyltransferase [Nitrospirae bacterium CG1_02_44_142]PIP70236.1 MAG: methionyl-tRNA formyltransferase [Nitrospirae bacterium CG22_combo_CG10-13_8_21_14_all_44_11]PIV40662.1 MAG: methionyl-tRNA formyltransferase [Nitrospirae bacterium CG02_land_8_20_14_3_00_44_33]PIV67147.1 MAG: methionyl-tRNA formyltransferase [Nitrospirae bacterium CG01_land_8_20_14_3_00_44_22]PIW89764.1 MAG: methionyl-tRNA formyltran
MAIVFFGTPLFAVASLKALIQAGEEISAVVTQPDKKKGRGHLLSHPPVKEFSVKNGLNVLQPEKINDAAFLNELSSIKPELIVAAAYGRILTEDILRLPALGCINVHASLLPKYRGAAPIARAIINGEKKTGITTMLMDKGLDTGDILLQKEIEIETDDTTETLSGKLSELGASLLLETISGIKDGSLKPQKQSGDATYAPSIKRKDGLINWAKTAAELYNFVRAMRPWPGAYCYLNREMIKLIRVNAIEGPGTPGRIEKAHGGEFIAGTGSGLLSIIELQPQNKQVMPAKAFLSGRNIKEGMYFT